MKITLNTLEWVGLSKKRKEWEEKTGMKASNEFIISLLSQIVSENLGEMLDQVFDIKDRINKEEKLSAVADKSVINK